MQKMTETTGNIVSTEKTKWRGSGQSRRRKAKRCGVLVMDVHLYSVLTNNKAFQTHYYIPWCGSTVVAQLLQTIK